MIGRECCRQSAAIQTAIAFFSITGGAAGFLKIETIHLRVFGRNVSLFEVPLRDSLRAIPVQISLQDVIDDTQLVQTFCAADVLLFICGSISSRRGSAIAAIASLSSLLQDQKPAGQSLARVYCWCPKTTRTNSKDRYFESY